MEQFLQGIIESLIANIPNIVMSLGVITYYLSKLKGKTSEISDFVTSGNKDTTSNLKSLKLDVLGQVNDIKDELLVVFQGLSKELIAKVSDNLVDMQKELSQYKTDLQNMTEQFNVIGLENRVLIDVIGKLMGKDLSKVQNGVATDVIKILKDYKGELEENAEKMLQDIGVVTNLFKTTFIVLGKETFTNILKEIGYEERKKETLSI